MTCYLIVKVGDDYVVRADHRSILKVAGRRRAVQFVSTAAELSNVPPQRHGAAKTWAAQVSQAS